MLTTQLKGLGLVLDFKLQPYNLTLTPKATSLCSCLGDHNGAKYPAEGFKV